jgi:hypothetical protein
MAELKELGVDVKPGVKAAITAAVAKAKPAFA